MQLCKNCDNRSNCSSTAATQTGHKYFGAPDDFHFLTAPYLVVYLNGRKVATDTSLSSKSYSELNKWPQLVFGTRTIHPANGESWDMQMDDLAIWYQELTEDQISFVYTKGKKSFHFNNCFITCQINKASNTVRNSGNGRWA